MTAACPRPRHGPFPGLLGRRGTLQTIHLFRARGGGSRRERHPPPYLGRYETHTHTHTQNAVQLYISPPSREDRRPSVGTRRAFGEIAGPKLELTARYNNLRGSRDPPSPSFLASYAVPPMLTSVSHSPSWPHDHLPNSGRQP
ncbi:hypothetical protein LZ30DRAFT_170928 [Colletotrichum cereale]|nr:hypothetical protein LZ30DRAFT_170928 [Colletotrichum cereale]